MKQIKYILLGFIFLLGAVAQAHTLMPYPLDTINGQIYYRYTTPRSIGIYRISVNFGVSQEEILKANPHLMTRGLRVDEVLLIPTKLLLTPTSSNDLEVRPTSSDSSIASFANYSPENDSHLNRSRKPLKRSKKFIRDSIERASQIAILNDSLCYHDSIQQDSAKHIIRIAVMLPLYADALKRDKNIDRFFDFYAGSLLAINEVQATGQGIEVFTYDVNKTARATQLIMQDTTWQKVDAIIGPVYPQQVSVASQFAQQDSTWLLVPFLPALQEVSTNPFILKFNPSFEIAAQQLAHYLATLGNEVNCVVFETKESEKIPTSIIQLHKALKTNKVPTTTATIRQILTDSLDGVFVEGIENIVIFNTENFNNLHALIPHLEQASKQYHITLYSQYSWSEETISLPQIYTCAFNDSIQVPAQYILNFQEYFGHELSTKLPRYDLLGYDLTLHLLHMLQQAHITSNNTLPADIIWNGTLTDIQYKKVAPQGGYENQTIHIIRK